MSERIQLSEKQLKQIVKQAYIDGARSISEHQWLTKKQACNHLGIASTTTFDEKVRAGIIPAPSLHMGEKTPRWDKDLINEVMGG